MKLIKKLLTIPTLILILFIFLFKLNTSVQASCTINANCDAPPGYCGSSCNGGEPCIIANGWYQTTCDRLVQYRPCTPEEKELEPYGQECPVPYEVGDCSDNTTDLQCIDSVVSNCCTPGSTVNPCGDGVCSASETCISCASDCACAPEEYCGNDICETGENCENCNVDCGFCPAICGNNDCEAGEKCDECQQDCGKCNLATCGDGSCGADEWCGNCDTDCGECDWCGDGSCSSGESCSSCQTDCGSCTGCGDGVCSASETCASCAADCGSCAADFCGDTSCTAFESCDTCAADCGACEENEAWFQISAGHIGSANSGQSSVAIQSDITDTTDCVAPLCIRSLLMEDSDRTSLTDGFAVIGNGTIDVNGVVNERTENTYASDTTKTRYQEKYDFFYRNSGLGGSPDSDFAGTETDAQKPTYNASKIAYYQSGNLTIQSSWTVASGETFVIFVDGNLTLTDGDGVSDQLIDVADGGFLAFIVKGNIYIDESLGNTTLTSTTANVEGVFIADGTLNVESRGTTGGGDDRFVGEGSFIGWSGINLDRDFSDGSDRSLENNDKAVDLFIYRPDFLVNMPDILLVPIRIWQETN